MPSELSEGQRQRAALGCALITNPGVILLDQPLIALDVSLRLKMRVELKRPQGGLGITFMQVARTQPEVIDLVDKMTVMDRVITKQGDHPRAVYGRPLSSCIARFWAREAQSPEPIQDSRTAISRQSSKAMTVLIFQTKMTYRLAVRCGGSISVC